MNPKVDRWLMERIAEPAKVVAEYRGYLKTEDAPDVIVRVCEYLPNALQGADPAARSRLRYFAEIVSLKGQVLSNGNPDESPELALANLHSPVPMDED